MLRFVAQALLVSSAVALQDEVNSPQISKDGENLLFRLPRNGDARFSRTLIQEVSLDSLDQQLTEMETFREGAVEMLMNKTHEGITPTIQALSQSYYTTFNATVGSQIPQLDQSLRNSRQYLKDEVASKSSYLVARFNERIDELKNMLSETSEKFLEQYNVSMNKVQGRLSVASDAIDGVQQLQNSIKTDVATGKWLDGKEVGIMPNWCFKWGDSIDSYSSSWQKYSGMDCRVASASGWLKITIHARTYGCNHGGLRVVGGGHTFGKQGTYGFQWMNSEHNGHRWLPFTIVRFVKATPGKLINYELQYRAQNGGCRFHIQGGTYGQQYAGLWFSIEEADEPMSKN